MEKLDSEFARLYGRKPRNEIEREQFRKHKHGNNLWWWPKKKKAAKSINGQP